MIQWLYRYVFRGIGIVFVIVMITGLILAISSQMRRSATRPVTPPAAANR